MVVAGAADTLATMPLAEVFPLVTARALARVFTYRVVEEVARGDVVSIGLGGRTVRGVVIGVGAAAPDGVEIADAGAVVDHVPAALVELALWVGTTTARPRPVRWHSWHLSLIHI